MKKDMLKITIAQLNPVVGDIAGNAQKARMARSAAADDNADLVVYPEMFLAGYPPEDLVLKPAFQDACLAMLDKLAKETADGGPAMLIGAPYRQGGRVYNSVLLLDNGKVKAVRHKMHLPNYGVFDEVRVFTPGPLPDPVSFRGTKLGLPICEDMWFEDVARHLKKNGAEILLVANGSPFTRDKAIERKNHMLARASETGLPCLYVNQIGGQDELVFDGASFIAGPGNNIKVQLPAWKQITETTIWRRGGAGWCCDAGVMALQEEGLEAIWQACVTGLRDYVNKNRFDGVVLGLSGGIDSALCAAMAVDALGAARVDCIMLPYHYTSDESLDDAAKCARALGVDYRIVPIEKAVSGFNEILTPALKGLERGITDENIQSRVRGTVLMAVSNASGNMVVTTGNKSEMSVGYATLYGDMNGGFNPIKDIYKLEVFALAAFRNKNRPKGCLGPEGEIIPQNIITKPPSAELRENQKDQDSLPEYEILDDILHALVEGEKTVDETAKRGHERELVKRIAHMLYIAEYKRRQSAPGVKISSRSFGRDRRYPITNGFREN